MPTCCTEDKVDHAIARAATEKSPGVDSIPIKVFKTICESDVLFGELMKFGPSCLLEGRKCSFGSVPTVHSGRCQLKVDVFSIEALLEGAGSFVVRPQLGAWASGRFVRALSMDDLVGANML